MKKKQNKKTKQDFNTKKMESTLILLSDLVLSIAINDMKSGNVACCPVEQLTIALQTANDVMQAENIKNINKKAKN